jgi:hypothetical protein
MPHSRTPTGALSRASRMGSMHQMSAPASPFQGEGFFLSKLIPASQAAVRLRPPRPSEGRHREAFVMAGWGPGACGSGYAARHSGGVRGSPRDH